MKARGVLEVIILVVHMLLGSLAGVCSCVRKGCQRKVKYTIEEHRRRDAEERDFCELMKVYIQAGYKEEAFASEKFRREYKQAQICMIMNNNTK